MDWITLLLFAGGLAGGIINALAGGATLLTFPLMLMAGLPPVAANASSAFAIAPGHLMAAVADIPALPKDRGALLRDALICLSGSFLGAFILLWLPPGAFAKPVPVLIALATLLFAMAPAINRWSQQRPPRAGTQKASLWQYMGRHITLGAFAIYGGFFGAGLGILMSALFALETPEDVRRIKVLKNFLSTLVSLSAIAVFLWHQQIIWSAALPMLAGALAGGYAGGALIRYLPAYWVRHFVIALGAVMSVLYAWHFWWHD